MLLKTLEWRSTVAMGNFIIQDVDGVIYPCKAETLAEMYEKVE